VPAHQLSLPRNRPLGALALHPLRSPGHLFIWPGKALTSSHIGYSCLVRAVADAGTTLRLWSSQRKEAFAQSRSPGLESKTSITQVCVCVCVCVYVCVCVQVWYLCVVDHVRVHSHNELRHAPCHAHVQ
jgi:hypothetical protein